MNIENHPYLDLSQAIEPICRPLLQYGITIFSFRRTFLDGKRINFTSNVNWLYDYYHLKLYQSSLFEAEITNYHEGFSLWPHNSSLPIFQHSKVHYGNGNGITLALTNTKYCDFFIFGADIENISIINFYINNLSLLKNFANHFLKESSSILHESMQNLILVEEQIIEPINKNYIYSPNLTSNNIILNNIQEEYKFSDKQMICLIGMLENKSAKQMAKLMQISHRTVEEYNQIIKQKSCCKNRYEVIKKFNNLIYTP